MVCVKGSVEVLFAANGDVEQRGMPELAVEMESAKWARLFGS